MGAPEPVSLLDWVTRLVADPAAAAQFTSDPGAGLATQGLADLDPADLAHAMPLVTDTVAARFHTFVDAVNPPAVLAGEGPIEALARHLGSVPTIVGAGRPDATTPDPDDWTESLVDDLAGAPDGLEGVVSAGPGADLDLDGVGDLDGVVHDHDLDVMTRLDPGHDLDGSVPAVAAAAPALGFLPRTEPSASPAPPDAADHGPDLDGPDAEVHELHPGPDHSATHDPGSDDPDDHDQHLDDLVDHHPVDDLPGHDLDLAP